MKTIALDRDAWDLVADTSGNIALASEPYAIAQDVASAVRLFAGELWYDITRGIPYFEQILGRAPSAALYRAKVVAAALTVPGTATAVCYLVSLPGRALGGQIITTTADGQTLITGIASSSGGFVLNRSALGGPDVL